MKARLLALTAVLLWSTASSAFKISLRWLSPYQLLLSAAAVSCATLWLMLLFRKDKKSAYPVRGNSIFRFFMPALRGLLNPFLYYLVLLNAYDMLPAQIAMVINYLWPIMLMLLSAPLLKQSITPVMAGASLLSFCGVGILALGGDPSGGSLSLPAMGLALLSTVIWALFWILNLRSTGDAVSNLARSFSFGLLYLLIFGLLTGRLAPMLDLPLRGIAGSAWVGLFEMGITFVVWHKALEHAKTTSEVGNYIYLTPFVALIFIGTAVGERIGLHTVGGLVLVILGILLQNRAVSK